MAEKHGSLSSWKEIAAYLNRTVRTCQRLEASMGLPVHRLDGSPKAHVFAYQEELDAWLSNMIHEQERKKRTRRNLVFLLASLAVVIAAVLVLVTISRGPKSVPEARPVPAVKSVAVLPFDDLSPSKDHEYLADGIAEAIRNALARVRGLQVIGRSSTVAVKAKKLDIREIRETLNVQNLVEGTVQVMGERLLVTTGFVNTKSGFQFWSRTYDKPLGDVFGIQDEISTSVLEQLGVRLLAGERSAPQKQATADLEAYTLYLKGRFRLNQMTLKAPLEALPFFEQACHRDPKFALAYAGMALAYINMQTQFLKPPAEVLPKAEPAVKTALELDPDLAEARALDAWLRFQYRWDWDAAGKSFEQALELNPGDAMTRGMYAMYLLSRKRFEEARANIKLAIAGEPLVPLLYAYSMWIHMSSSRPQEVLKESANLLQIEPNAEPAYFGAGMAYLSQGRIDEAEKMFEAARRLPWNSGRSDAGLVSCYLKKGRREAAETLYGRLRENWEDHHISPVMLGFAAAALGKTDQALDWLKVAIRAHDPHMPFVDVYAEAFLPDFARDPCFLAILDSVGLPH